MGDYAGFDDKRIKHMEMIQTVVTRLAGNSFLIKGWAVTLAVAFFGFSLNASDPLLAGAALVPAFVFWGLDAYFLKCERLFRALYAEVRRADASFPPFFMGATSDGFVKHVRDEKTPCDPSAASWWKTGVSRTLLGFYGALLVATGAVITITYLADDAPDDPVPRNILLRTGAGTADSVGDLGKVYVL